jgi:Uncharacterized membrane protein, putative virulence factor
MTNKTKKSSSAIPAKTIILMMAATFLAKFLGMLRGALLSYNYGTSGLSDAFTTAQNISSSFFDFIFAAAIGGCFIPVYTSFAKNDSADLTGKNTSDEADRFACVFLNVMILIAGVMTTIGMIAAKPIVAVIASDMEPELAALTVTLLRIMFPIAAFAVGTYTLVGVLQSKNSFLLPALLSAISNAGVILYFLFIDERLGDNGIYGLAAAYLLSWVVQFLTLAIPLMKMGFKFRLIFDFKNPALIKALKNAPPILLGSWLMPAGALLGTTFADKITLVSGTGTIAAFGYANGLYIMIAGILTYSVCNFLFPKLSRLSAENSISGDDEFKKSVRDGVIGSLSIIIPVMAGVFILSGEGVAILYGRGEFTVSDVETVSKLLSVITLAMPAFAVAELGSRVFYARGMVAPPVIAALSGVAANAAVTSALIYSGAGDKIGMNAVGFGNAAGQITAAAVFVIFAHVKIRGIINAHLLIGIGKTCVSSAAAYTAMKIVYGLIGNAGEYSLSLMKNAVTAVIVFAVGAAVYLALMYCFKSLNRLNRRKEHE